jgi:hypothetical protein
MATIERSADLVAVGANGGGWVAPAGTAQPADLMTAPTSPWDPMGAISDDGLKLGFDEDSQEFTPWGLTTPFRTVITKSVRTFQMTLWETLRPAVVSIMYRVPVTDLVPDGDGVYSFSESSSPAPDRRAYLFDVYDGDTLQRFYIPQGEVTDRDDVTFKQDEMSGYGVTISTYPDDAGITMYRLFKPAVAIGGGGS